MKKSLGQNFLRDPKILKKIVDFARIEPEDTVVEIGPGEGRLTKILIDRAEKVIAVEKDGDLVEKLKQNFCQEIKDLRFKILEGDILEFDLETSTQGRGADQSVGFKNYILVGNIPYYITGAIFEKFLQSDNPPKSITFVVQKEVAARIMSKKGSILSMSIKAFGDPEYGGVIKAGSFFPKPKVDSAIIAVRNINKERFIEAPPPTPLPLGEWAGGEVVSDSQKPEEKFFKILKQGFAHKRKLLIKNLGVPKTVFDTCDIPEKARAEDLKVEDWIKITELLATSY